MSRWGLGRIPSGTTNSIVVKRVWHSRHSRRRLTLCLEGRSLVFRTLVFSLPQFGQRIAIC